MDVQETNAINDGEANRNSSYCTSNGFVNKQYVPVPMELPGTYVEKDICWKTHSGSSTCNQEEMSCINREAIRIEPEIDCFKKESIVEYQLIVDQLQKELRLKTGINEQFENEREEMLGKIKTAQLDLAEKQRTLEIKNEKIILLGKQLEEIKRSKDCELYGQILAIQEENEKLNGKMYKASIENEELRREMRSTHESLENQLKIKDEHLLELDYQLGKVCDKQIIMKKDNMKKVKNLERECEEVMFICEPIDEFSNEGEGHDAMANAARDCKKVREELEAKIKTLQEKLEKQDYQGEGDWSGKLLEANKKIRELEDILQTKSLKLEEERQEIFAKTKEFVLQRENKYSEKVSNLEQELMEMKDMLMRKCEEMCQLSYRLEVEQRSKEILMKEVEDRENELELKNKTIARHQKTQPNLKAMEAALEEEKKLTNSLQDRCVLLDKLVEKEQNNRILVEKELKTLQNEKSNIEEKDEQITALECQLGRCTKQMDSVKEELENEKMNTTMLANEIVYLKEREVDLEKKLLDEVNTKEMLKKDLEQIKQEEIEQSVKKSGAVTYEEADSLKVFELECFIEELKNKIVEQEKRNGFLEESLGCSVKEKHDLQMKLNETVEENVELQDQLKQNLKKITSLEEKITELEKYKIKGKNEDKEKVTTLKEEIVKLEENIAMWQSRCKDYEVKLQKERQTFGEVKQSLENENERLNTCNKETKYQLEQLKDERKVMNDRLLHLESKMILLPDIESLRQEVMKLQKEFKNEKENAAKCNKLSKEYFQKLNKKDVTESFMPPKITSNSKDIFEKNVPAKGQVTNLPISLRQELKKGLQDNTIDTPTLMDEVVQVFMSPITRNLSNLGFSTPGQVKSKMIKPTQNLAKPKINPKMPKIAESLNVQSSATNDKGMVKLAQQSDTTKKRKDGGDHHGTEVSKTKRTKTSPFVLGRRREIKACSKTSIPCRLPQPRTRTDSRSKITRRTTEKTMPGKDTDEMFQFPQPKSSEAECKMQ